MKYRRVLYDLDSQTKDCCDLCAFDDTHLCSTKACTDKTPDGKFIDYYFIVEPEDGPGN